MRLEINLNEKEYQYFSKKIEEIVKHYNIFKEAGKPKEIQELIDVHFTDNKGEGRIIIASEDSN